MKGCKSPTIGTKDFSHPLRTMDDFDETIDDFSLASIALSLKAISMNSILLDTYGASDRLLFSEKDYRTPSNSKVISALQELMCDKDFCTLYSLFMLALARKELSTCSFWLFIGEKPILPQTIEDLSTKATDEELREAFVDEWGVKYSKDGRKLLKAPQNLDRTYSIRNGTKVVCDRAFCLCSSLTEIVIPNSVASIGDSAFEGCNSLGSLVIPNSVINIGKGAFKWCKSLAEVVIPNSVTNIGKGTFANCSSLADVVIPEGVTSIGNNAFMSCSSLEYISIPKSVICLNGNPFFNWNGKLECLSPNFIYEDDVLFNKDKSKIISFRNQKLTSYVIPDSVTSIGDSAFYGCRLLSNIVIPNSVTSIGDSAFKGCKSLGSLVIPNSVTNIGKGAFKGCKSLVEIVIPNSVTSIGYSAFRHDNFPNDLKQELISRFGGKIFG